MFLEKMTYAEAVKKVESIKILGINEIYLNCKNGVLPWKLVTRCDPGGLHRLEISTDVWFYATDTKHNLNFRWSFELEPRSANGSGSYHIDIDNIRKVLRLLSGNAKIQFRQYLADCAIKVKTKGDEWMKIAMEQQSTAQILQDLVCNKEKP